MTDKLPPNLLALFAPRPPLRWVQPVDVAPAQRQTAKITGLAEFLPALAAYKETDKYVPTESWLQARDRKQREKKEKHETNIKEGAMKHKPSEDPNIRGDAFKTLIVARLSYDANEHDLEREFGRFGPIERIRIVTDTHAHEKPNKKKKPHRGYAFVVFDREKDMRGMLMDGCDGIRIKDRRIKVDVERGRTVKGWKPRRFGGGLGGRGYTKAAASRPTGPGGFGGGFGGGRDGFRGGFGGGRGRGGGFRGGDRGFRGGGGGMGRDRGFGPPNGFAPPNAPSGPGSGGRSGGYGDRDRERDRFGGGSGGGGGGGGYDSRGGGRSYDDRSGGGFRDGGRFGDRNRQQSGANNEPVRERGDRDRREYRDQDRSREDDNRKRGYDGGYEDPRKLRRY
ncbi:U1 small nuclear ribonucleo protein of 70kDa MW N terminal-domain-containing protein [Microdochium bolleyi]|uniref:U1 small nuclear ribonucleo protein of 70kDa MW N terminal-domain-containing protein n=1 Tax=Microdochium bolleyi TaxID=196109 RepID=A0A136JKI9_9PEZI|nr:U1 small nuclear ribonucleo protein of 70kDa MW N terminal-domain-containing protein [Microdochium bolleyi]